MLKEGDIAPDFTATTSAGATISLRDFRGKSNVVLSFYPRDFTPGCTAQACSYRDNYGRLTSLNAVLIGVSHDSSASHGNFAEAYNLPYQLISDSSHSLSRLYGAVRLGGLLPFDKRVTYVLDRDGVIRKVAHYEFAIRNHIRDIIATLEQLEREAGNLTGSASNPADPAQ